MAKKPTPPALIISSGNYHEKRRETIIAAVRCSECHVEWGLRKCKKCSELVPYTGIPSDDQYNPEDPFEIDSLIGRDVLAYPVKEGEDYRYLCYNCGNLV